MEHINLLKILNYVSCFLAVYASSILFYRYGMHTDWGWKRKGINAWPEARGIAFLTALGIVVVLLLVKEWGLLLVNAKHLLK